MRQELVERAIGGDHDAFSVLARDATPRLYGAACLILRDRERAEDAVQEALISAWRDISGLREPRAWEAWLHRLAVRSCYRMAARERRRRTFEIRSEPPERIGTHDDMATLAARDELAAALGALPLEQRAVLVVHFYLDQPIATAASVLGISVGTCKSRLSRGLAAMRSRLGEDSITALPVPAEWSA